MANFGTYEGHRIHSDAAGKMVDSASRGFQILANAMENEKQRKMEGEQFDRKQSEIERSAQEGEKLEGRRLDISRDTLEETKRSNLAGEEDVDERLGFNYSQLDQQDQHFYSNLEHEEQQQATRLAHDWRKFVEDDANKDEDRKLLDSRFYANLSQEDKHFYDTHGLNIKKFNENVRQYNEMDKDRDINTASNVAVKGAQTANIIEETKGQKVDREHKEMQLAENKKNISKNNAIDEFVSNHGDLRNETLLNVEEFTVGKNEDGTLSFDSGKKDKDGKPIGGSIFDEVSKMTSHQSKAQLRRDLKEKYPNQNFSDKDLNSMLADQKGDNAEVLNQLKQKFNNMDATELEDHFAANPGDEEKMRDWIGSTDDNWDKSFDLATWLTGGDAQTYGGADNLNATSQGFSNFSGSSDSNFSTAGKTGYGSEVKFKSTQDSTPQNRRKKNLLVNALGNQNAGKTWVEQTGPNTWSLEVYDFWGNDDYHVKFQDNPNTGKEEPYVKLMNSDNEYVPISTIEID